MKVPDATLDALAAKGVRTVCFHEHWTPWQSHPYTTPENEPKLTAQSLADRIGEPLPDDGDA